jgi:ArsR family transcriptional regulator, arsenate/arsenite/antimonite-responsive transcriptional repressor
MGLTKTEVFNEAQNQIAEYAKAFAHPARVAILQYLVAHRECICGDLVEVLPLSQSTISQHLKELKRIGIIKGTIDPPKVCYCIDEVVWEEAQTLFVGILNSLPKTGCC